MTIDRTASTLVLYFSSVRNVLFDISEKVNFVVYPTEHIEIANFANLQIRNRFSALSHQDLWKCDFVKNIFMSSIA